MKNTFRVSTFPLLMLPTLSIYAKDINNSMARSFTIGMAAQSTVVLMNNAGVLHLISADVMTSFSLIVYMALVSIWRVTADYILLAAWVIMVGVTTMIKNIAAVQIS